MFFTAYADFFYNTDALMTENATVGNFRVFTLPNTPSQYRKSWF